MGSGDVSFAQKLTLRSRTCMDGTHCFGKRCLGPIARALHICRCISRFGTFSFPLVAMDNCLTMVEIPAQSHIAMRCGFAVFGVLYRGLEWMKCCSNKCCDATLMVY